MIIAPSQYPNRHCDEHWVGWCEGRRSNLKLSTIHIRKEIASSANPQYRIFSSQ
jgi:hypothetical protein